MARRSPVQEVISNFAGQKSALPFSVLQSGDATNIIDWVSRKGKLRKIWGTSIYSIPVLDGAAGGIKWIDNFDNLWAIQQGNVIALETGVGSKVFAPIGTILLGDQGNRVYSDKWKSNLYMTNGVEVRLYENSPELGQKYLNVGLFPPGNGLLVQQALVGAEDMTAGTIPSATALSYLITFFDKNRQTESLPNGATVQDDGLWLNNNPVVVTNADANKSVKIDWTNLKNAGFDADRVTHVLVYRAATADGTFKRIPSMSQGGNAAGGAIPIAQNFAIDSIGDDTQLGTILDQTLSPPPTGRYFGIVAGPAGNYGARFVKFFRDQLWLFGVRYPGDPAQSFKPVNGLLYASQVNDFDYWQFEYGIGQATDQDDTGIGVHRNTLILFKEGSAYYLDGNNPTNYVTLDLDTKRGIIAPGSLQETPFGIIGLSAEGFCLFDSISGGRIISDPIFDEIDGINHASLGNIVSAYDNFEQKYECHIPVTPSGNVNKVFLFDCVLGCWSFTTRAGGAAHYARDSQKNVIGLLGDIANSRLYNLADKTQITKNGQTINSRWASKHFDFSQPHKLKRLQKVRIMAQAAVAFKLSIDIIPDFGQQQTVTLEQIDPEAGYSQFDVDKFDLAEWDGSVIQVKFSIEIQCVAKNIQLVIRNNDTSTNAATLEIQEVILEGNIISGEGVT